MRPSTHGNGRHIRTLPQNPRTTHEISPRATMFSAEPQNHNNHHQRFHHNREMRQRQIKNYNNWQRNHHHQGELPARGTKANRRKEMEFQPTQRETETISFTIPTTDGWTKFFTGPVIFYIISATVVIIVTAIACVCLAYAYKKRRARRNNLRDYEMTVRRNAQSREYEDSRPASANYPLVRSAQASAMRRQR